MPYLPLRAECRKFSLHPHTSVRAVIIYEENDTKFPNMFLNAKYVFHFVIT